MKDDEFRTIIAAFREENTGATLDAQRVRRRLLVSLRTRRWRSARRVWALLPIAAVFVGGLALAAANRVGSAPVTRALSWWSHPNFVAALAPHQRAPQPSPSSAREVPAADVPVPPPAPGEIAAPPSGHADRSARSPASVTRLLPAAGLDRDRPHAQADTIDPAAAMHEHGAAGAAPVSSAPIESDELALYRAAHDLHFEESQPARAAQAWESYLRAFPDGELAVEARFNLALCLVKTGRIAEAEPLLERFATGSFGSYRQTDARTLLRLLRRPNGAR